MDRLGVGTFINTEAELTSSSLDIFTVPPVDAVILEGNNIYYYPLNAISDNGPFEFIIPKDPDSWTALPLTRLEGEISLEKIDGSDWVAASDLVSVVNLFPQSIFKQVECELNGIQVCDLSTPTYSWKSFIETQLTYGKDAKDTHLANALYLKDTEGKETTYAADSDGWKERFKQLQSRKFPFSILIHSDFFQSQKYLLPNIEIKLKLIRNADTFSLLAAETLSSKYKLTMKNLRLQMRRIKIDPIAQAAMEQKLKGTPALYDITQSKIKTFLIPSGTKSIDLPSMIQGNLPRSVIFGFVTSAGFNGSISGNPFYFNHQNVNLFNLKINGKPVVPTPFTPDFSGGNFAREYRWFTDNTGILHENETNGITKTEYLNNSNFWCFDLSPDLCNSFHNHKAKQGSMDLSLGFSTETTQNLHMLLYGSFNSVIAIDHLRNVTVLE